ncbi:hypothetical protein [Terribacillus sp. DMT04]|uniref:hypothetical protein n=1 Tax=Terribacillus sp. DMT04 TaxID=2850441 RepID=UPI001C2CBA3F|nr:hypothetical protein [Terribacillus sp. DMT04]QXE03561.1 hypothetical protein KS242_17965 [Terribacillus sp. DMT04]
MLLNEQGIDNLINEIEQKSMNLESIDFTYNPNPEKTFTKISGMGFSGIAQDEDYYENIKENIIAAETSWFEPMCSHLNAKLDATVAVMPEGDFNSNKVTITANLQVPKYKLSIYEFLYKHLTRYAIFHQSISKVEVLGYKSELANIIFTITIDSRNVIKTLKNRVVNKQIIEQWIHVITSVAKENEEQHSYRNHFDVVNGKMNTQTKTELISGYFVVKKKGYSGAN